jgi:hypothetical protein
MGLILGHFQFPGAALIESDVVIVRAEQTGPLGQLLINPDEGDARCLKRLDRLDL